MGLAVLFPGQGAQTPGMLEMLRPRGECAGLIDVTLEQADLVPESDGLLPAERIFANRRAQPLIVGGGVAIWSLLAPRLPRPVAILGYSVGEITAAHAAGALDAAGAVKLARHRAALMEKACDAAQAMLAIRGYLPGLPAIIADCEAYPAIVNGPDHLIVAGRASAILRLEQQLNGSALSLRPLPVTIASHCPLMLPAVPDLHAALIESLSRPMLPLISGWSARRVATRQDLARALAEQIAAPVQWALAIEAALERGATAFLEIGPSDQMTRILRELHPGIPARSVADFRVAEAAADWVARVL